VRSKEKARNKASNAFFGYLAHEIVHQFQDPNLPKLWGECAARYYEEELAVKMGFAYAFDDGGIQMIDIYSRAVDRYGDDVHQLFFNGNLNDQTKNRILNELSEIDQRKFSFYI
jgi:hypothetical protein